MEMERRWEELDVLALIFARLGIEDKVVSLPFVCKSWSRALLVPLCWRSLDFASINFCQFGFFAWRFAIEYPGRCSLSFSGLLKLALRRSQRSTTELFLPFPGYDIMFEYDGDFGDNGVADHILEEDLELVEKECLGIKTFSFAAMYSELEARIPKMVANWANLETLKVRGKVSCFEETLAAIKEHCPRFRHLMISLDLREEETNAIVTLLPSLKRLFLYRVFVDQKCLMSILYECKELEELRMESCSGGFYDDDVVKRAASFRTFVHAMARYHITGSSDRTRMVFTKRTSILEYLELI